MQLRKGRRRMVIFLGPGLRSADRHCWQERPKHSTPRYSTEGKQLTETKVTVTETRTLHSADDVLIERSTRLIITSDDREAPGARPGRAMMFTQLQHMITSSVR